MISGLPALLADQNIHPEVTAWLRSEGHSVVTVEEAGLAGASDKDVVREATRRGCAVLTHDSDFGRLAIAEGEPVVGVVFVRPGHINPAQTIETLRAVHRSQPTLTPPFLLVAIRSGDSVSVRVRQL